MPNYRRARNANTWFFTVVTHGRIPILTQPHVHRILQTMLAEVRRNYPFHIQAWTLLPDHIHTIWRLPDGDSRYSLRWGWFKKEVTKQVDIGKSVWQP